MSIVGRQDDAVLFQSYHRNLTDPDHGLLRGRCFLIMDRDPAFSERFRNTLKTVGVERRPHPAILAQLQ